MRAVIDINVIVSAWLNKFGTPARVLREVLEGRLTIILTMELIAELERAIRYQRVMKRVPSTEEQLRQFTEAIAIAAEIVSPKRSIAGVLRDPDDHALLEAAAAGNANVVITGDKDLTDLGSFEGIRILRPADFMAELDRATAQD